MKEWNILPQNIKTTDHDTLLQIGQLVYINYAVVNTVLIPVIDVFVFFQHTSRAECSA